MRSVLESPNKIDLHCINCFSIDFSINLKRNWYTCNFIRSHVFLSTIYNVSTFVLYGVTARSLWIFFVVVKHYFLCTDKWKWFYLIKDTLNLFLFIWSNCHLTFSLLVILLYVIHGCVPIWKKNIFYWNSFFRKVMSFLLIFYCSACK